MNRRQKPRLTILQRRIDDTIARLAMIGSALLALAWGVR